MTHRLNVSCLEFIYLSNAGHRILPPSLYITVSSIHPSMAISCQVIQSSTNKNEFTVKQQAIFAAYKVKLYQQHLWYAVDYHRNYFKKQTEICIQ